jgi:hypothetical protein
MLGPCGFGLDIWIKMGNESWGTGKEIAARCLEIILILVFWCNGQLQNRRCSGFLVFWLFRSWKSYCQNIPIISSLFYSYEQCFLIFKSAQNEMRRKLLHSKRSQEKCQFTIINQFWEKVKVWWAEPTSLWLVPKIEETTLWETLQKHWGGV